MTPLPELIFSSPERYLIYLETLDALLKAPCETSYTRFSRTARLNRLILNNLTHLDDVLASDIPSWLLKPDSHPRIISINKCVFNAPEVPLCLDCMLLTMQVNHDHIIHQYPTGPPFVHHCDEHGLLREAFYEEGRDSNFFHRGGYLPPPGFCPATDSEDNSEENPATSA